MNFLKCEYWLFGLFTLCTLLLFLIYLDVSKTKEVIIDFTEQFEYAIENEK